MPAPTTFDLAPHLAAIADRQPLTPRSGLDMLALARRYNDDGRLGVYSPTGEQTNLPGIVWVDDPEEANVTLLIYRENPLQIAEQVEACFASGERVAVVDASHTQANRGDIALLQALLDCSAYTSNLAALDTDVIRALATVMVPLRRGQAFRKAMADSVIRQWLWEGMIRSEVERRFGEVIPARWMMRAETQTRARVGAWMHRLGQRGLTVTLGQLGWINGRTDQFWYTLR
jgi:hypothetical protein